MVRRFRDSILLIAGVFAGVGGYLIHDSFADSVRSHRFWWSPERVAAPSRSSCFFSFFCTTETPESQHEE
jgi:hypothetical protein